MYIVRYLLNCWASVTEHDLVVKVKIISTELWEILGFFDNIPRRVLKPNHVCCSGISWTSEPFCKRVLYPGELLPGRVQRKLVYIDSVTGHITVILLCRFRKCICFPLKCSNSSTSSLLIVLLVGFCWALIKGFVHFELWICGRW